MQDQVWGVTKYETAAEVKEALIELWSKSFNVVNGIPYKAANLAGEINKHFNVICNPYSLARGISFTELAEEIYQQIQKTQRWDSFPKPAYAINQKIYVCTGRWYVEERVSFITPHFKEDGSFDRWVFSIHGQEGEYELSETKATAGEALKDICRIYIKHFKGFFNARS